MKFDAELNKPVLILGGQPVTLRQLATARTGESRAALAREYTFSGSRSLSLANIKEAIGNSDVSHARQLAIARLRSSPGSTYRFLDGKVFTANEAIVQIEQHTKVGDYFTKLEKRAAEIAIEALEKGQIQL